MKFWSWLLAGALLMPSSLAVAQEAYDPANPPPDPALFRQQTQPVVQPDLPAPSTAQATSAPLSPAQTIITPAPIPRSLQQRAEQEAAKPRISGAWARVGEAGGHSAVYMSFTGGTADDRLLRVTTAWAEKSELHETVTDSRGITKMLPALAGFSLPARGQVVFSPGGKHIMLSGLQRSLRAGQSFPLNLTFEKAGTVRIMVTVKGMTSK